jgi:predicted DNA-binding protein
MKKILIGVTETQDEKLEKLKKNTGLDKSEHVRRALDDYFIKIKKG